MNALWSAFSRRAAAEPRRRVLAGHPGGPWIPAGELLRRSVRLGERLAAMGLRRGEICAVAAGNRPLFVTAVLAAWSRGALVLPLEESLSPVELRASCDAFGPALLVRGRRGPPQVSRLERGQRPRHPGAAMIRLTSGSTGVPRGALVTPAQLAADGRAIVKKMGITPGDTNVAAIPLGHSYGFDNVILPLVMQGTPALLLERPLPSLILRALASRRPTVLPAVPYLIDLLARHPGGPPSRSGLRLCISAGAPLAASTSEAFRKRFGVKVRSFYGASECGGITFDDGGFLESFDGSVGTPLPGVRIEIRRRGLGHLPPGEGRVVVRGPAVATRYLPDGSPDLGDGRFRTSDIGRLDPRGRLHLTGRLSSLINVSGKKINPLEIEMLLREAGGVEDAVVMGVRDPLRGQKVEAWVAGRRLRDAAPLRRLLAGRLSPWKMPRIIHLVRSIPRTRRGKVDRVRLLGSPTGSPAPEPRRSHPRLRR